MRLATVFLCAALFVGCAPAHVETITYNGRTESAEISAQKRVEKGECRSVTYEIRAQARLYGAAIEKPPNRLTLEDTDCEIPFRVERGSYISDSGTPVHLSGQKLRRFWGEHADLRHELVAFAFQKGVYQR